MRITRLLLYILKRYKLLPYSILLLLASALVGGTWREWRQENLNQALVAEVKENNTHKVFILLDAGADPNTHDIIAKKSTFWSLFHDIDV